MDRSPIVLTSFQLKTDHGPKTTSHEGAPMSTVTAQPLAAGTWTIDRVHSHVGFAVKHMVVSTFRGQFEDYDGSLTADGDGSPRLQGQPSFRSSAIPASTFSRTPASIPAPKYSFGIPIFIPLTGFANPAT